MTNICKFACKFFFDKIGIYTWYPYVLNSESGSFYGIFFGNKGHSSKVVFRTVFLRSGKCGAKFRSEERNLFNLVGGPERGGVIYENLASDPRV